MCDDGSRFIITYNNNKISSIEYYYDFGSQASATENLSMLATKFGTHESFNGLIQNNNYVRITFNTDDYQNMSFSDIISNFSHQEEIIK